MSRFRTLEVSDPQFENGYLRHLTVKSPALRARADLTLFLPPESDREAGLPLVILLHGVYGSHWAWALQGGAHRTAAELIRADAIPPLALAMPSDGLWGDGSGYLRHGGADYEAWILDDVPAAAAEVSAAISPQSPIFLCGLSMGGYGALRLGAKHAGRVRGISAHSAITDFPQLARFVEEPLERYGPPPADEGSVLHWMLRHRESLPPVRFDCGVDDPLLEENRALHRELTQQGIAHRYEEFPGGHEWPYWARRLRDSLRFFAEIAR